MYGLTECFDALYTTVNEQVPLQIYNSTDWFSAIWTNMHLYPTVCQQVSLQMSSKSEWFVAFSTFVWLLGAVNEHVSLQIYSLTEWFVHSEHMCNFSPIWVNIWLASWLEYLNDLTHMLQGFEFAMSKIWSVLLLLLVDNDWGKFVPTLYMICPSTKKSLPCTIFIITLLLLDFSSLCGL